MVYRWEGYKYSVPAQTVGEICEQIEAEHGSVTKQALVDASRDADAPTHALFEWDNAIASEKWRCHQAGQVLSCLKITVFNKEGEQKPIRAYYNVSEEPTPRATYINIEKACLQADSMEVILRNALRELIAFKEKYKMLNTLKAVFDAIDQVTV